MTIIQALTDVTAKLERYEAQMKVGISHGRAEVNLAESEKIDILLRIAQFYILRQDLCGNHNHLIKPLNQAMSVYIRVVQGYIDQGIKACDEKTDKISRRFMQRLAELEKEIEAVQQPIPVSQTEASEGELSLVTLSSLPTELLEKIFGFLGDEFLFVLRSTCIRFNHVIQLKKKTDPIKIHALFPIITPVEFCTKVALPGYTNLLRWGRANGCPWDIWTCANAALNGHLETLKWARANGCPWNERTCANAAANGHLEILRVGKG